MSNMSYCRFENTQRDLQDCREAIEEMIGDPGSCGPVNKYEMRAAPRLFDDAAAMLSMLAEAMGASITVTTLATGEECDLEDFEWKDAFEHVQQKVKDAQEEEE